MRLLHFDALNKLFITDFHGKLVPPYAILSHRWSDSETLIEDIYSGEYKEKKEGYRKLKFCAEQAARDNLQYFWIDTCCIDRWNNNERSKAINSMFQWYQNASRCYVFLSDVSPTDVTETTPCNSWEASFSASSWFTRGWTLQELIAPKSVEFYSREGQLIGNKASLEQLIHNITGIPPAALHNSPLDQFSTSERMRWAKNRTTTEEEDIVYCLLGLLSISMPATYGEGQMCARRRLQAEIDLSGSAPSIIPFSQNESFIGRELQVAELEAKLFSNNQTTTTLAIVGLGGTGKSQVALEVAHRARLNNKDCSVFWIDATDKGSLYQSYASVGRKLSILSYDDDQACTKQAVKRCVAEMSMRQCLLIFDNVEGLNAQRSSLPAIDQAALLVEFLPQSTLCSVIFTTTENEIAKALAPQHTIVLHALSPGTALDMLKNCLARTLSHVEEQEAMHLLEQLLYLPLAIVQAAAHIEASSVTVQQYQAQLAKHKETTLKYGDNLSREDAQEQNQRDIISATLSLSISQIRYSNPVAADYLCLAACVNQKDILLDLLESTSPQAREDAIKLLDRYALVTRRPAESALDVHRLVHYAIRKRMQAQGELKKWDQLTVKQLLLLFPNEDYQNRSRWRRLLPHAQRVLSNSQNDDDKDKVDLASKCATALCSDGRYKEAEELEVQVVEMMKRVFGSEHHDTLTSMGNLALTYWNQGSWDKAEELEVQVVKIREKAFGSEHSSTLISIANLALTYCNQGRWAEAEELEVQVTETRKKVLGNKHPDTLVSLGNLASTYRNQGRWKEAEELEVQVMETRKEVLSCEHPDTLTSMGNLASTYRIQGRWDKAEELEVQVVEATKRVLGNEHPDTLTSMGNLASTYWNLGRWAEAEELEVQVMETRKRLLGSEHPDTLISMHNLACTLQSRSRYREALALIETCFQSRQQVLGEQHPSTRLSLATLHSWRADLGEGAL